MSESARDLLVRGVAAARAHSSEEARFHLEWVLRTDADLAQQAEAWYWLSRIAGDPAERRACLERTLAADPTYPEARRDLAILDGRLAPDDLRDPRLADAPIAPASQVAPGEIHRYRCPRCGGALTNDPGHPGLFCQFCGYRGDPAGHEHGANPPAVAEQDWVAAIYTARGHRWELPVERVFTCQSCGASHVIPPGVVSLACPSCGSPYVVQAAASPDLVQPDGVAPFAFDAATAGARAHEWLVAQRFRPDDLDERAAIAAPRPLYLPFWTFDLGGTIYWQEMMQSDEREPSSGTELVGRDDLLVAASATLPADLRAALRFDTSALTPYAPELLAGWPAEIYQVSVADASLAAHARTVEETRAHLLATVDHRGHDLHLDTTGITVESYKLALLPVWLTDYRYRGERHPLVVNGQSGAVHGSVPRSTLQRFLHRLGGSEKSAG
ncbi:MAG TPA: hypothetical protein VFW96_10270 [Thermomicrobiales bacterium]|nr:hypothetical protein [Thermomicrobiales bacterium]